MRPLVIDENKLRAMALKVGAKNARQRCTLEACEDFLKLVEISAGEPKMVERPKLKLNGKVVLDDKKKPILETVQATDAEGNPIFEGGELGAETTCLYQVCSSLVQLLKDEWTYS